VREALTLGITYVDTAPLYGLGASERRVGAALAGHPRETFALSTKVGRLVRSSPPVFEALPDGTWPEADGRKPVFDFSRDGIRRSLAESIERLGIDRVDIVYVHDPDDHLDQAIAEALPALAELRDEGVVGAIGAGMTDAAALTRIVREAQPDCVLVAGRYTLLDQSALAGLLPECLAAGVDVVVGGVFNSGLLANPVPGARFDYVPADQALLEAAQRIGEVCEAHGVPLPAAAVQFALRHPAVVCVLTGVRSVAEIRANVDHFNRDIPADLWSELEAEGILPHPPDWAEAAG
jgi:D-threo-aldose 1-dehydrogenase